MGKPTVKREELRTLVETVSVSVCKDAAMRNVISEIDVSDGLVTVWTDYILYLLEYAYQTLDVKTEDKLCVSFEYVNLLNQKVCMLLPEWLWDETLFDWMYQYLVWYFQCHGWYVWQEKECVCETIEISVEMDSIVLYDM